MKTSSHAIHMNSLNNEDRAEAARAQCEEIAETLVKSNVILKNKSALNLPKYSQQFNNGRGLGSKKVTEIYAYYLVKRAKEVDEKIAACASKVDERIACASIHV